jgi:hypothetical protein
MRPCLAGVLLLVAVGQASTADKRAANPLISPIDNFQDSLVASAAHGTTLALQTMLVDHETECF